MMDESGAGERSLLFEQRGMTTAAHPPSSSRLIVAEMKAEWRCAGDERMR